MARGEGTGEGTVIRRGRLHAEEIIGGVEGTGAVGIGIGIGIAAPDGLVVLRRDAGLVRFGRHGLFYFLQFYCA